MHSAENDKFVKHKTTSMALETLEEMCTDEALRKASKRGILTNTLYELQRKYERFQNKDRKAKNALIRRYLFDYAILLPLKPAFAIFGLIIYVGLLALEPYRKVRIGIMKHNRIGGYGMTIELFLRRLSIGKDVTYDRVANYLRGAADRTEPTAPRVLLGGATTGNNDRQSITKQKEFWIFLSRKPANHQLLKMIKQHILVLEHPVAWQIYHRMLKRYVEHSRFHPFIPGDLNDYEVWNGIPTVLSFTPEEEVQGLELLDKMGIGPNDQFICFHTRDKVYLDTAMPGSAFDYHSFRNCDIENCIPAAEYIAAQGHFTLRMGHRVEKPVTSRHQRVIDYATHHRSDFGDVYLLAKCKFFLGSNTGLATIPLIFNRPVALTNVIDVTGPASGSRDLTIFKKLWLIEEKRFMTFREIIERGVWAYLRAEQFTQTEIEVIENPADEILALAKEMNERLNGTWIGKDEDEELQNRFRSLFPPGFPWSGFPGRIGAEFLRQNRELLD